MELKIIILSLNPCFSGTHSRRATSRDQGISLRVLILVLVEHTLGVSPTR